MSAVLVEKPKFGLALSGASSRALFYIGFLEGLTDQGLAPDYIGACSSATIVAASYACGTLTEFRNFALSLDKKSIFDLLGRSKRGGWYSLDMVEETIRKFTKGLTFEEVRPLMGFMAVDLQEGKEVVLSLGDLAKAARISCTVPGIFEPVPWGGKILIDGGLLSMVPTELVKGFVDVTVTVNTSGAKYIFEPKHIRAGKFLKGLQKLFLVDKAKMLWDHVYEFLDNTEFGHYVLNTDQKLQEEHLPGMFSVLGRSIDLTIAANSKEDLYPFDENLDILITPVVDKLGLAGLNQSRHLYELGLQTAHKYGPIIKEKLELAKTTPKTQIMVKF